MKNTIPTMLKVTTLAMLALAIVAFISACSGTSSGSDEDAAGDDGGQVVEHVDDEDGDDAAAGDEEADGQEEANAYLEAAPKDSLVLVEMSSFAFAPNTIEVGAGEVLEIAIQNAEPVLHDFTIDKIDADAHVSYLGGTGQHEHMEMQSDADVHFALTEPASGVVHLKVTEPGEYVFYCTVPGHRDAGMEGTLIVQ